jgi:hypothetical protein
MEKTTPVTAASPTKTSSTNNKYAGIKNMYKELKKGVVSNMMIIYLNVYADTNITSLKFIR